MEYTTESTNLQIVKMKDDNENGGWGAAIKRSLMPSQFYVIEKKPEIASSFYFSLVEPTTVFTLTKSAPIFLLELLLLRVEPLDEELSKKKRRERAQMGGFNVDDLCMQINVLENRPMWIDDSEIQSITELCEKCRRMKEERHIQFVVIDDFLHVPIPQSVREGAEAPDAVNKQLCQLAKELGIVVVALLEDD
jgi:replicative DNA helicase